MPDRTCRRPRRIVNLRFGLPHLAKMSYRALSAFWPAAFLGGVLTLAAGCGESGSSSSSPVDASRRADDAGAMTPEDAVATTDRDRGLSDARVSDARPFDARVSDARLSDAGLSDARLSDARFSDARFSDAGDAGTRRDAAEPDHGPPADGGPQDASSTELRPRPDARVPPADLAPPAPDGPPPPRYHPEGYDTPEVHGAELRLGADDCRRCHGPTLEGDHTPSCDACHTPGWRTNCTYCHGGVETLTGAPPRDLNGEADPERIRFRAHTVHTSGARHPLYGCRECHQRPDDVLSDGHVFDETPGRAEIDFSRGLSRAGGYPGNGQCSSLYCHGTGAITGNVSLDAPTPDCETCHATAGLLGPHRRHVVQGGLGCQECHALTTDGADHIVDATRHVDGHIDVSIPTVTLVDGGGHCTGMCHGEDHQRRVW